MEPLLAIVIGILVALSVYLMLRRNLIRVVIGIVILSNAVNLLIFTLGRLDRGIPPLIASGEYVPSGAFANPLPQALVLTAIVIGFGLLSYALVLVYRAYTEVGTLDVDDMRVAEPPYKGEELPASAKIGGDEA
ncbi:multisubunit sodium/proton antiporter, MrpC subunit [Cyclonatronum proteinivorum]|uniref:Multisubunit sodium/proton antiporter, MrpC subunit n=1 Tax=Cyclonatronum proteinivorum TaxID=1457365 RepID=A0A345UHF2_9BACT|nr:Na+/H+ antiporter subunit C [Cyclonatronum proteinivorum]AXI99903.1 multisubunit sodium/proton antiporter, MrpC subunit [Cyclonatronum proteinivorum]